ncbi:PepSY-like domain-containing protein [Fimbriiglobus ruber]|uniref:Putative beta-lactamase-inhibitor-like PepSY-like domain-containing protein n=1 Tax=Fimbriiglobus ruber TaxID=1908690 RepID=A0A225DV74_9BACT|nr:PepSY-like domain-containing protein [Fimbriiglobus ruber]OWK45252.1 hypothetical protein FRUB_01583 [Fimbriiglobus ruber]
MSRMFALAVAVVAGLAVAVAARADEEKIPLDKLPKAVVDAVKAKFPKAEMKSAEKETEKGKTVYEVAIADGDAKIEVTVTPEGKIVAAEKEIKLADLPKPVAAALDKAYPKAEIKKVEEITKDDKVTYEVLLVSADKKKLEVVFDKDGKVIETEDKSKEKEGK